METTPSSTRRITRSQTRAANSTSMLSWKTEGSGKSIMKSEQMSTQKQQQDRTALIDITNDSPIVGVAMGNLETPSSAVSKKRTMTSRSRCLRTPGSGEALLRGQVKTLLQKVEEEAELSKIVVMFEKRPFFNIQGSPFNNLMAPTPANTPQVFNSSVAESNGLTTLTQSPVTETFLIPEMMFDQKNQETLESENGITRSLLMDFSEKSESTDCSSVLTHQGALSADAESTNKKFHTDDDDDSSIWSIQANASSTREEDDDEDDNYEDEEGECEEECNGDEEEEEDWDNYGKGLLLDEVCEGMNKMNVTEFKGKHIRFVYNSDDELQGEELLVNESSDLS